MRINTTRFRGGKRKDLGNVYFRSASEANYARHLKFLKIAFQYEPRTFMFSGVRRGNVSYTPDFYLPKSGWWIEVKGYLDQSSKTKLRRFKKYYPKEFERLKIVVHDPWSESKAAIETMRFLEQLGLTQRIESYKEIDQKLGGLIPNWE